jgi:hypothetical protein
VRRGAPAAVLGATAFVVVLLLPGAGAVAQTSGSPAPAPAGLGLDVVRLTPTVPPDGLLRMRVAVANRSLQERDGLRLVATLHRRTRSRFAYQQAVDAGVLGAVVHAFAKDLDPVPPDAARTVDLVQTSQELGLARVDGLDGVYPLRLQLVERDEVAADLVTSVVVTADDVPSPLATALVLTVEHPPSRDANGVFVDHDLARALEPGGALASTLDLLSGARRPPVTVAADAQTLEEVADLADGYVVRGGVHPPSSAASAFLAGFEDVLARPGVELVPLPYASADLVALVRGGLGSEASRHLTDGARALEEATGRRPSDDILVPPDGLTAEALGQALDAGARAVVLSPEHVALPPITGATPSSLRRLRAGPGASVVALVADPWLEATLEHPRATPALAAQRILGELATIYFERPGRARRGVLLRLPAAQAPGLLDAVAGAPFLAPMTLREFRQDVREEAEPVRLAYPPEARPRELEPAYLTMFEEARDMLGSLDGVLVTDRATAGRFDRVLLQAASTRYRAGRDPAQGEALLRAVISRVEDLYSAVEVPETPAVTLTSLEGELPVTVRSGADVALRVRVELRTARLEVDGGPTREIVLEPGTTHVLMLPVRALSPGSTAPVDVAVTDADGRIVLASGQVVVRSTAFSVTAVFVVTAAASFLLVWWLQEARRRRRSGSRQPGTVGHDAGAAGAPARPPHATSLDGA